MHILLIEDNEGDVFLTKEAWSDSQLLRKITVAKDGQRGLDYLRSYGNATDGSQPDLVLLDINLPKLDGYEVLAEVKSDPQIMHIPIIVFTTSSAIEDILKAYEHQANCYISKPQNASEYHDVISAIEHFWILIAKLPTTKK